MSPLDADVVVVGAGICGIHCAVEVERLLPGARVIVLEASDVPGGRIRGATVAVGDATFHADLGAHYISRKHRRLVALAERHCPDELHSNVENYGPDPACRARLGGKWTLATRATAFLDVQGLTRNCPPSDALAIFRSLSLFVALERMVDIERPWATPFARELDALSFQDWLDMQDLPRWIVDIWQIAALGILSAHAREMSMLFWVWYNASSAGLLNTSNDYEGSPQEYSLADGLTSLVARYAATLGSKLRTRSPVATIDHGRADRVTVTTAAGRVFSARHVVVAAAPSAVGRTIRFAPDLCALRREHLSQPMGHAIKAVCHYRVPWWRDAHGGLQFASFMSAPGDSGVEWVLDSSCALRGSYALLMFVSDRLVDALPDREPATIRRAVLRAAVEVTGDPRAGEVAGLAFYDWRADPWVGGGPNTILRPGLLSRLGGILGRPEAPHERLHFASAEQSTEFTGYVEGGLASAERTAEHVAAAIAAERAGRSPSGVRAVHGSPPRGTDPLGALAFGAGFAALTPAWLGRPLLDGAWRALRRPRRA